MRAQNDTAIHWTESTDRDALSEIDDLYFLLVEDLLHRVTLISCKSDARVFEVEVEAIELQRLGAHFLSCPEDVNILARFCFLCLGALLGIVLAVTPAQQQLGFSETQGHKFKAGNKFPYALASTERPCARSRDSHCAAAQMAVRILFGKERHDWGDACKPSGISR